MEAPEPVLKLAEQLDYNSVVVVGIALKKRAPNMHWVYVPDKNIVFHRYAWISNYSPYNTPDSNEYSALIAEITISTREKPSMDRDKLLGYTIDGLKRLGIVSESEKEVIFTKVWVHEYGYPVHTISSNKARKEILEYLAQHGIITLGRWGTWRYINMDKVFKESIQAVANIRNSEVRK